MDWENITRELNRRFAEPPAEFYKRRIIFWYDEDREFDDSIEEIELENAKLLVLTGRNNFVVKKILAEEDTESNYLVYCPIRFTNPEGNWLLNIALYSEEYRADRNSMWMEEMGISNTPYLRQKIKEYSKFFNVKEHRKGMVRFVDSITIVSHLHLAVMAILCGQKEALPTGIVRAVLAQGTDMKKNASYKKLEKYGATVAFWMLVQQLTGYNGGSEPQLNKLAAHILITAVTRTMREEHLLGLNAYISPTHQAYCYDMVTDWLHQDVESLYKIAHDVEEELHLYQRFSSLEAEELIETECLPCIHECILVSLMREISHGLIRVDTINDIVNTQRTKAWYAMYAPYYEGMQQVANMQEFDNAHYEGFHLAKPEEIWRAYERDYYRMDSYYRQFHLRFSRILTMNHDELDDLFRQVVDEVERLYGKYLAQLSSNWTAICEESLVTDGFIPEINRQSAFYSTKVESRRERRMFVVISDALRYEVAAELAEQLKRGEHCKVKLGSMQGIFPTITKFGMAALLPHHQLNIVQKSEGRVSVLADNESTEMPNRDKVLKSVHKASVALQHKDIIGLTREARKALVKNMDVVYIYHNKIDEASHGSDNQVFTACDDAIAELRKLVRIICNDFGGTRVCITSDHGFLYTYSPLTEVDKADKKEFQDGIVEYGRRYALTKAETKAEYLMPVKINSQIKAFAPRENIRLKMNGGGLNFVHGGISLQEMVVPLIEFHHVRTNSKQFQKNREKYEVKPVGLTLLSANRKLTNLLFSLNFHQMEPVADMRIACPYKLYFVDVNNKQISNVVKLIADKQNENAQERVYRHNFSLKSNKYSNRDTYYLIIEDESGLQMPQRIEFQIDIAMAVDEFNFCD